MAAGVPVAAVPASGVAGLLADGRGAVAPGISAPALAGAIASLLPAQARARAAWLARAHVQEHHNLDATAARLAALYGELAQARAQVKQRGASTRARRRAGSAGTQIRRTS
jgi:glycosyltransferase involved in cell wall biosynthesis